jgi:hypothetical protein
MKTKLIELFEKVQAIPYRCRSEELSYFGIMPPYANCNQKRNILRILLEEEGFESRDLDAVFDWKDLPIPEEIMKILRNSGTQQKHHLLEVRINGDYFKIDPTWNPELRVRNFPVTEDWDGESDTQQITNGKIKFYHPALEKISLPYFPQERGEFAREFNRWLGW